MKDISSDGWMIVDFKSGKEREASEYEEQLEFYKNQNLNLKCNF